MSLNPGSTRLVPLLGAAAVAIVAFVSAGCGNSGRTEVVQDLFAPPAVPPALNRSENFVQVRLEAVEVQKTVAPGVSYKLWTFNDTVPGPMIRVHEGDTVEIQLHNNGSSSVAHNIDLHAVNGPGGGAEASTVAPGETKVFTFKALAPGLFTYHCAAGIVADHIANGMYGGILVEPANGLPKVDHEFYVGQSDIYTDGDTNEPGTMQFDLQKLLAEQPTYVVFNGSTGSLNGSNALKAKVGETTRIYFVNGGPNLTSSLHLIGEIFDKAWAWGSLKAFPAKGVQTITTPPGGASIVEFKLDVPGDYKLVDHALGRVAKGAVGTLRVTGKGNSEIFDGGEGAGNGGHEMTPEPGGGAEIVGGGPVEVEMKDNVFAPKTFSVKAGTTVTFELPNTGKVPHNMRVATLDGNYDSPQSVPSTPEIVSPAKEGKLEWKAPAEPGTYKFRCDIHPTEMTGTITVS